MTKEETLRGEIHKSAYPSKRWVIGSLWIRVQWGEDLWVTDEKGAITRHLLSFDLVTKDDDTVLRCAVWRLMLAFAWL
jgi:hypothetical protein